MKIYSKKIFIYYLLFIMSSVIYTLVLVSFLSILSFSQMAPFYPLQAKEMGVSVFLVGFVLA